MNDHYYTREPQSESRPAECDYTYRGERLRFRDAYRLLPPIER